MDCSFSLLIWAFITITWTWSPLMQRWALDELITQLLLWYKAYVIHVIHVIQNVTNRGTCLTQFFTLFCCNVSHGGDKESQGQRGHLTWGLCGIGHQVMTTRAPVMLLSSSLSYEPWPHTSKQTHMYTHKYKYTLAHTHTPNHGQTLSSGICQCSNLVWGYFCCRQTYLIQLIEGRMNSWQVDSGVLVWGYN